MSCYAVIVVAYCDDPLPHAHYMYYVCNVSLVYNCDDPLLHHSVFCDSLLLFFLYCWWLDRKINKIGN